MYLQVALDRMTIQSAVGLVEQVRSSVDYVEVGTSLIKEYGMDSIRTLRLAFPDKILVADIKTLDNVRYELELCFKAGADVATIMAVAPEDTIELGFRVASEYGKTIMLDFLNCSLETAQPYMEKQDVILCAHVGIDQQERSTARAFPAPAVITRDGRTVRWSIAGGVGLDNIDSIVNLHPHVVIVGGAIVRASNPTDAARQFRKALDKGDSQ